MTDGSHKLQGQIRMRWWFTYLYWPGLLACAFVCGFVGLERKPDRNKIEKWVLRAMIIDVRRKEP